jgi:hypothetical protein
LLPNIEAEDLPDVSENSNDSWVLLRKTQGKNGWEKGRSMQEKQDRDGR